MFCCISASLSRSQEFWPGAAGSALRLSAATSVGRQPAAFHRLCRQRVHLSGPEARLWGAAHHHRCLLGALWDLGGEQLWGSYCTVHTHTHTHTNAKLTTLHKRKLSAFCRSLSWKKERRGGRPRIRYRFSQSDKETDRQSDRQTHTADTQMERWVIPMEKICFSPPSLNREVGARSAESAGGDWVARLIQQRDKPTLEQMERRIRCVRTLRKNTFSVY